MVFAGQQHQKTQHRAAAYPSRIFDSCHCGSASTNFWRRQQQLSAALSLITYTYLKGRESAASAAAREPCLSCLQLALYMCVFVLLSTQLAPMPRKGSAAFAAFSLPERGLVARLAIDISAPLLSLCEHHSLALLPLVQSPPAAQIRTHPERASAILAPFFVRLRSFRRSNLLFLALWVKIIKIP